MLPFVKLGSRLVNVDSVRAIDIGRAGSISVHLNGEQPFTVDGEDAAALMALVSPAAGGAAAPATAPAAGIKELPARK